MEYSTMPADMHLGLLAPAPQRSIEQVLGRIPVLAVHAVSSLEELRAQLDQHAERAVMVVLDEWPEPQRLVRDLRSAGDWPLIVVTSQGNEALGLAALSWGAHDYLLREQLTDELVARTLRCARQLDRLQQRIASLHARLDDSHQRLRELVLDITRHRQKALDREARWILDGTATGAQAASALEGSRHAGRREHAEHV